jgi:hypothetical protein
MPKLYIYDESSSIDRKQAVGRFEKDYDIYALPVSSIQALHEGLSRLVSNKATFDRVLFQTHGNSGMVFFNHEAIQTENLKTTFAGKNYHQLFPYHTRMYFDGCNVAEGEDGWRFLEAAGTVFLRGRGGVTFGFTNMGTGMPGWLPFIGGHTIHFGGTVKYVTLGPGGVVIKRHTSDDERRKRIEERGHIGNKI